MVFWWICCGCRIGLLHFMSCVLFMPAQVHFLSLDIMSWRFIYPPDEMGYVAGLLSGRGNISLVGLWAYWEQTWHWWHHSEMEWTLWAMSTLHAKIPRKIKGCLSWVRLVTALLKLAFSPHCPEKTCVSTLTKQGMLKFVTCVCTLHCHFHRSKLSGPSWDLADISV
jgi:hypothetical protein